MDNNNYIFGASGHAKVVLDCLLAANTAINAIIDDNPPVDKLLNIPVLATKDFDINNKYKFIIAIGDNAIRKKIATNYGFTCYNAIHPQAVISDFATLGKGIAVMPLAVINAEAIIGNHCIINSRSVVEHDCILEDYVHISPNASLAGNVRVGEGTQVGIGASVIQGITIGKWVTVGAGAVIIKDIPDYAVVVGNPGTIIKYNAKDQ